MKRTLVTSITCLVLALVFAEGCGGAAADPAAPEGRPKTKVFVPEQTLRLLERLNGAKTRSEQASILMNGMVLQAVRGQDIAATVDSLAREISYSCPDTFNPCHFESSASSP